MTEKFNIGLLSTINSFILPWQIKEILKQNLFNIFVICDSKIMSEKDRNIWLDRTNGELDNISVGGIQIFDFEDHKIPFYFVNNHNSENTFKLIKFLSLDILFNAGTPRKLNKHILNSTTHGVLNVHPGILPKYRGCSAVEWAIYNDDKVGNTAHFMTEGYDEGNIIDIEWYKFPKNINYSNIRVKVYKEGFIFAGKSLKKIKENNMIPSDGLRQDETKANYWKPIPTNKFEVVKEKIKNNNFLYQKI